jgi:hypothetical protein
VTSSTFLSVFHEGDSASGNTNFTGTLVPRKVVLGLHGSGHRLSAVPGHHSTSEILGFTLPGVAIQIQVAFRPAK